MKQDIQLNFDQLECIYTKLGTYIQHVIELRDVAEEYYNVISEQVSETFKGEAQIWYDFVLMKIEALLYYAITDQELLERYLTDMQAIIAPKDPTQMMRVDRADICWNLSQVADTLLGLADVYFGYSISYPDYKATIWNDLFSGYSISERIELEKKESENRCYNYWRMSDMRSDLRNAITAHIENHNEEYIENQSTNSVDNTLWTVYNTRIKAFENKDDELGKEAQTFYEEFDAFKDYATDFLYKGAKFAKGFWDAAVGTLDGLYTLYMAMKPENQLMCWVGLMNPSTEQRITGFNETIKLLFTDQELLLENIGQGLTDSLETEGISYYLGGMAFDSLLGYGSAKVIEKIADLAGTGKTAGKIADVLDETSYGKSSGNLNWDAIVSKKGETRVDHINRHAVPNNSRETHGVFNGNPIDMVNDAWEQRHLVEPISDGMGGTIYNIPYKNAGYESGFINTGAQMDYITIVTMDESADLITAFPSFGDYHK